MFFKDSMPALGTSRIGYGLVTARRRLLKRKHFEWRSGYDIRRVTLNWACFRLPEKEL
jgi:hypothetical protein